MKSKKGLVIVTVLFVALLGSAFALYSKLSAQYTPNQMVVTDESEMTAQGQQTDQTTQNGETEQEQQEYQPVIAPDFTVYDIDGNAVKLSDFYGKPLVINFWASWCGPCQMEMPEFEAAYQQYSEEVNFVIVNMTDGQRETIEAASSFIADNGYTFPVYYDTAMDAAATYAVYTLPATYFADKDGYLVAHAKGALNADMMAQGLAYILE